MAKMPDTIDIDVRLRLRDDGGDAAKFYCALVAGGFHGIPYCLDCLACYTCAHANRLPYIHTNAQGEAQAHRWSHEDVAG